MIALLPSEIARLVLNYLDEECCKQTYKMFLNECTYLSECKQYLEKGICLPKTIHGKTLKEYLIISDAVAPTPAIELLPRLKHSVSTQTKCIETRSSGTETTEEVQAEPLLARHAQMHTPVNDYSMQTTTQPVSLATTPSSIQPQHSSVHNTSNNSSGISYSNKRKYEIQSPANSAPPGCVSTSHIEKLIEKSDNDIFCTSANNQSNNSTPKKRRLIIGKNTEKVPELSISTIERHLELLVGTPQVQTDNSSSIQNQEVSNNDDMYDLNNTTLTNVLNNQAGGFNDPTNDDAQLFLDSFIKNNLSTPQKLAQECQPRATASILNAVSNDIVLNSVDTNRLNNAFEEEKQPETRKSNSQIVITKMPQTRSQTNLKKMQDGFQMQLQASISSKLASAMNNLSGYLISPSIELSPNRTSFKLVPRNENYISLPQPPLPPPPPPPQHQQQPLSMSQLDNDISSASTSASTSPNVVKKKRIYNRRTPTIRKMMDTQLATADQTDQTTAAAMPMKMAEYYNYQRPHCDLNLFTPPSTNGENEDSSSHDSSSRHTDRY